MEWLDAKLAEIEEDAADLGRERKGDFAHGKAVGLKAAVDRIRRAAPDAREAEPDAINGWIAQNEIERAGRTMFYADGGRGNEPPNWPHHRALLIVRRVQPEGEQ